MNSESYENPQTTSVAPSRLPAAATTFQGITGGGLPTPSRAMPTPHTTSTYISPPWSWAIRQVQSSSDQLVPMAALAVILAALVAIVAMLALIAILAIRAL